ncbi:MAG: (E)-4-hydroxy-3-methylbut-2-enyl-diphosphate synthase [Bacteroidales bacterium]|nr:(E)-4-hydroxy-3-methylbut-2-enyl-diphosphate synthase [Bacteroidales bacterium]
MENKVFAHEVRVGNVPIGGENKIAIQSMTNVPVGDIQASVNQCKQLFDAGADLVRLSVPRTPDIESLRLVKKQLDADGYKKPLVADVHFSSQIAEECARIVEKVRINPGNYIDKRANFKELNLSDYEYNLELEKIHDRLLPLIKVCREYGTAIRIGSNHGSLSDRILSRYGNTARGMVEAAMEFISIFGAENFHNLVISMKASNVKVMTESCELLTQRMIETGYVYPQHLGVTEAGAGNDARIKSCLGIAYLLNKGIGDTIRVSLTENPVNEITFAKKFMSAFGEKKAYSTQNVNSSYTGIVNFSPKATDTETAISETCIALANGLIDQKITNLQINGNIAGIDNKDFVADIMQAAGICISKAEFISCPGCGRTNYDLERISEAVKREFSHLKGLKIATMGCVVNGPGEMADADYGCVGSTKDHVIIYKGQTPVIRDVPQDNAVEMLKKVIADNGDWKEK